MRPEIAHPADPRLQGTLLEKRFPATYEDVRNTIIEAGQALKPLHLNDEDLSSVEIVLAEALNNVVEHGYSASGGDIYLKLRRHRAGILIQIMDWGRPMPGGRTPAGAHPATSSRMEHLPEGGYGWFLIRELARDLIYDRDEGENILIFRLALGPEEKRATA